MKKGGGWASTIIIGPSKSVQDYTLHSLEERPRASPISGVCAKIIIIIILFEHNDMVKRTINRLQTWKFSSVRVQSDSVLFSSPCLLNKTSKNAIVESSRQ